MSNKSFVGGTPIKLYYFTVWGEELSSSEKMTKKKASLGDNTKGNVYKKRKLIIVKISKCSTGVDIGKIPQLCWTPLLLVLFSRGTYELIQRSNSWTKSRQKSREFSSLLFTVIATALPLIFLSLQTHATSYIKLQCKGGKPDRQPYLFPLV